MSAEDVLLKLSRGFALEIVEARFADHQDLLTGIGQRSKLLEGLLGDVEVGCVGVDADACVDVGVLVSDSYGGPGMTPQSFLP